MLVRPARLLAGVLVAGSILGMGVAMPALASADSVRITSTDSVRITAQTPQGLIDAVRDEVEREHILGFVAAELNPTGEGVIIYWNGDVPKSFEDYVARTAGIILYGFDSVPYSADELKAESVRITTTYPDLVVSAGPNAGYDGIVIYVRPADVQAASVRITSSVRITIAPVN